MSVAQLSIVVPTLNRPHLVVELLHCLAALPDHTHIREVVLVDQSDGDHGLPALPALPFAVIHLQREYRNVSRARNEGVSAAASEIVLFLDDDCRPGPGCIAAHLRAFEASDVGGATGPILAPGERIRSAVELSDHERERLRAGTHTHSNVDFAYRLNWTGAGNLSCRRGVFLALRGFDETLDHFSEDAEFCNRLRIAGHALQYDPAAIVIHTAAATGGNRSFATDVHALRSSISNSLYFHARIGAGLTGAASALWTLYRQFALNRRTVRDGSALARSGTFLRATVEVLLE